MEQIQPFLDAARNFILSRIPEDRNSRILLAGGAVTVAGAVLYPLVLHYSLSRQVTHTTPNASSRAAAVECGEIETFPSDIIENPKQFLISHDKDVKYLPKFLVTLSNKNEDLFNKVLRRNMLTFSRTLQSFVGWFLLKSPEVRKTFTKEYIEACDFQEGDLVCGVYRVAKRTPLRVEYATEPPNNAKSPVSTMVVQSLRPRGDGGVLTTETVQWARKDSGVKTLPNELWFIRFLHKLTNQYMILTGAQYLQSIAG